MRFRNDKQRKAVMAKRRGATKDNLIKAMEYHGKVKVLSAKPIIKASRYSAGIYLVKYYKK